jgi:hypothetical protein
MLYDADASLGQWGASSSEDSLARVLDPQGPNPAWSTELIRLLLQNPDFTDAFVGRCADLLNTWFASDATLVELDALVDEMAPMMPRHLDRWGSWSGGGVTQVMPEGEWEEQLDWMHRWLERRPDAFREHLVADLGLAGTWTLELSADPPGAGTFALSTGEVEGPFSGVYFGGVPVTVTAVPSPGYSFAGWSDPSLPADPVVRLERDDDLALVARFR